MVIIKNYELTKTDTRLTEHYVIENGEYIDYHHKVCVKPWGHEFLSYMSNKIGIWILHIKKDNGTSIHTHFKKGTILLVLNGKIKLELIDGYDYIYPGMYCFIPKRKFHGIFSVDDNTIIMEIEIYDTDITYSDKNDLLRLIDKYKRSKIGYESSIEVETENLEKYDYFSIDNNCKYMINTTTLNVCTFNKLNLFNKTKDLSGYVILLDGEINLNNYILKEGSIIKTNELFNCKLTNQIFLHLEYNNIENINKIITSEEELEYVCNNLRNDNKKIVLTCGCFDILHVGHMHILSQSKKLGDKLIVCLSSDEQIKYLKGDNRPINTLEDRLNLFTTIPYVDYVYVYYEDNTNDNELELDKIMNIVSPDVWTKGSDYTVKDILIKHPSLTKIDIIELIDGKSTTNIINKVKLQ